MIQLFRVAIFFCFIEEAFVEELHVLLLIRNNQSNMVALVHFSHPRITEMRGV